MVALPEKTLTVTGKPEVALGGTIAKGATAKVRATLKRGKHTVRGSAKPVNGRWAITFKLTGALKRKGINALTVTYEDAAFARATARKRISMR